MSRIGRAFGYVLLFPSGVLLSAQLAMVLVDLKLKQRRSANHFRKGLMSAGLSRKEAERIRRVCFDGR